MKNIEKNNFNSKKALTLLSLAITITVLLVLGGVIINATIGNNGLFSLAKKTKQDMEDTMSSKEQEINDLYSKLQVSSDGTITVNAETLQQIIDDRVDEKLATYETGVASRFSTVNGSISTLSSSVDSRLSTVNSSISTLSSTVSAIHNNPVSVYTARGYSNYWSFKYNVKDKGEGSVASRVPVVIAFGCQGTSNGGTECFCMTLTNAGINYTSSRCSATYDSSTSTVTVTASSSSNWAMMSVFYDSGLVTITS